MFTRGVPEAARVVGQYEALNSGVWWFIRKFVNQDAGSAVEVFASYR